jgi:hypothetical protein
MITKPIIIINSQLGCPVTLEPKNKITVASLIARGLAYYYIFTSANQVAGNCCNGLKNISLFCVESLQIITVNYS